MSQGIDDFTIVPPHLRDMGACELKVYSQLDQLWRMVERYKMTAPITIKVLDHNDESVRLIRGHRDQASDWQLRDEATGVDHTAAGEVEFPLTIRVEDAKGNILKMRLQLEP
jgi:hypothetical protein